MAGSFLNLLNLSVKNIATAFLQKEALTKWTANYKLHNMTITINPKTVGIVMAGNIPLVGFHDLLCVFITGHKAIIKAFFKR